MWAEPRHTDLVALGALLVAVIALVKTFWDEHVRKLDVDGRVGAQAFLAQRTIRSWRTDSRRAAHNDEAFVGIISGNFGAVAARFERMAEDAPRAHPGVAKVVRESFTLFFDATDRIYAEQARPSGQRNAATFADALKELWECEGRLAGAIDKQLGH